MVWFRLFSYVWPCCSALYQTMRNIKIHQKSYIHSTMALDFLSENCEQFRSQKQNVQKVAPDLVSRLSSPLHLWTPILRLVLLCKAGGSQLGSWAAQHLLHCTEAFIHTFCWKGPVVDVKKGQMKHSHVKKKQVSLILMSYCAHTWQIKTFVCEW